MRFIHETHRFYDPLQYVLMFPRGESGFELYQKTPAGKRITPQKYYRYQLMWRDNQFNTILRSYSLLDQFAVDMWAKIERQRLRYFKTHQKEIKAGKYDQIQKAKSSGDPSQAQRAKILPATFTSGPRFMNKNFHDAMRIVEKHGLPDL